MMTEKILVIGQGYVGLPISMRAIEVGYHVVGLDNDESRILKLQSGVSFVEDVSNDALHKALDSGRFKPTSLREDAIDFDVAVITVPTPLRETAPDLSYIESAARNLSTPGCQDLCVLESIQRRSRYQPLTRIPLPILEPSTLR